MFMFQLTVNLFNMNVTIKDELALRHTDTRANDLTSQAKRLDAKIQFLNTKNPHISMKCRVYFRTFDARLTRPKVLLVAVIRPVDHSRHPSRFLVERAINSEHRCE